MRFISRSDCRRWFDGRSVAIVGSGPGVLDNAPGFIDGHDVVLRVNNYKLTPAAGFRTDVFYSFFGTSIRKSRDELIQDGVTLCMSKLPDADIAPRLSPMETAWHRKSGNMIGIDYRPHYARRARMGFWFCETYVPTVDEFFIAFDVLGRRQPTSGFGAIFDMLSFDPRSAYLTGFDFFRSGLHNVDEPWAAKNMDDPIRHAPERELAWVKRAMRSHPVTVDPRLKEILAMDIAA